MQLGVPATCNAGGAGKWKPSLNEFCHDADDVVVPDRDPQKKHPKTGKLQFHPDGKPVLPGQDHARSVASALHGVAKRVSGCWSCGSTGPTCRSRATSATGSTMAGPPRRCAR